jgi:hypothetical protein
MEQSYYDLYSPTVASPDIVNMPVDDSRDLYASEHLSDATIILQEEDTNVPIGSFHPAAVPAAAEEDPPTIAETGNHRSSVIAASSATDASTAVGGYVECRKRRRTASSTDGGVDSTMIEAAAGEHTAAAPTDGDGLAAAAATENDKHTVDDAGKHRRSLPGHAAILHSSSSYCKAKKPEPELAQQRQGRQDRDHHHSTTR